MDNQKLIKQFFGGRTFSGGSFPGDNFPEVFFRGAFFPGSFYRKLKKKDSLFFSVIFLPFPIIKLVHQLKRAGQESTGTKERKTKKHRSKEQSTEERWIKP